ncbi:adenine deaminase [Solirubrobacter sp. CPCC 204708]|uniref:adenine deaminase n=1 Tax=Solirubrobacter deserti TaxID=2282478 RepID=A0ABT4RTJ7_9ACTN|nr:adenine deaminase C-terminal domain-containing protein [Solirubrobacter deserti]MBE2316186.1 adenine deaminase [Solirubrobacter deserti]MDA0141812.1 amidohydrolase family protein [Solirubrobacter deserti]
MQALVGATIADVYTGTWIRANVEFDDGVITYVGPRAPACEATDITGKLLVPGYIEPHTHPWCLYSPASLLEVAVPDGTTTLVYDNLFFFLSHGVDGLRRIVEQMRAAPAHIRWVARISPQSAYPDEAERFAIDVIEPMLSWPEVVASGEITNWMSVARGEPRVAAGIAAARAARRRVEGHNAGASYDRLNELSLAGISADHEAITAEEALSRLRLGMWTMLRQSSLRPDLPALLDGLRDVRGGARRLMLTTDGATPSFYEEHGVIGGALRIASERGVEPMRALQMATIDPATFLGLDERLGGIAPGRAATFNVLPEVGEWRPETVYVRGEVVAREGRLCGPPPRIDWPAGPGLVAPDASLFAPLTGVQPVARYESAVINRRVDRAVEPDDVHAVLVGRDGAWAAKGVVENFLDVDGFATTATTSLELLVVGRDPAAMARAAARVAELGGGFAFDGGWSAPLEVDGLISAGTFDTTVAIDSRLSDEMRRAGYPFHDPLYSLLFASGDFLPELRVTPSGLLEVKSRTVLAGTVRP